MNDFLTVEEKEDMLSKSCRQAGLDAHILKSEKKSDLGTMAEIMMWNMAPSKNNPHKNSYLYCDSVDSCFYIEGKNACVTFTARWFAGSKDLEPEKVKNTALIIRNVLTILQSKIDEALQEKNAIF